MAIISLTHLKIGLKIGARKLPFCVLLQFPQNELKQERIKNEQLGFSGQVLGEGCGRLHSVGVTCARSYDSLSERNARRNEAS